MYRFTSAARTERAEPQSAACGEGTASAVQKFGGGCVRAPERFFPVNVLGMLTRERESSKRSLSGNECNPVGCGRTPDARSSNRERGRRAAESP